MTDRMKSAVDLLAVGGTFILALALLNALGVPFAGPFVILATVLMATWRLKACGASWPAIGLARPASPLRAIGIGLATLIAAYLIGGIVSAIATQALGLPASNLAAYGDLRGNPGRLALLLIVAWSSAGFGEEMLFRGFTLTRLEGLFGGGRTAVALAVVGQALLFGVAHSKQGATGIMLTATIGLVFGAVYARTRTLWPLIVAHIVMDTVSLVALYAGAR